MQKGADNRSQRRVIWRNPPPGGAGGISMECPTDMPAYSSGGEFVVVTGK